MSLLALPPELLSRILNEVLHDAGIRAVLPVRLACHTLDHYILETIYALPTFEDLAGPHPPHITWDPRMSKPMVAGLIHTKLRNRPHLRSLTSAIQRTVDFVAEALQLDDTDEYAESLVNLAVRGMPMSAIVRLLSTAENGSKVWWTDRCQNALLAALFIGNFAHAEALIPHNPLSFLLEPNFFGDLLEVAASRAGAPGFRLVLCSIKATSDHLTKLSLPSRLIIAFESAAAHAVTDVFCEEIADLLRSEGLYEDLYALYRPALRTALIKAHCDVVRAILAMPDLTKQEEGTTGQETFWLESLRAACSGADEQIMSAMLGYSSVWKQTRNYRILLEDAARAGREDILSCLIDHCDEDYTGLPSDGLFWAGRNAIWSVLPKLFTISKCTRPIDAVSAALCGASVNGFVDMSQVLQIAASHYKIEHETSETPQTYSQVIDGLLASQNWRRSSCEEQDVCSRPASPDPFLHPDTPQEGIQLSEACSVGNIIKVQQLVKSYGLKKARERRFSMCFSVAIRRNRAAILLYLCEKLPSSTYLLTDCAVEPMSTAIFRIMLDRGWNMNEPAMRMVPPPLGDAKHSEQLTSWMLNEGADPNGRCDWDITPLSRAVQYGSWSVISLLVNRGGDIRKGQLLHFATLRKDPDKSAMIDWLLARGVPIDARAFENEPQSWVEYKLMGSGTALHTAAAIGDTATAVLLVSRGANRDILDSVPSSLTGRTALDLAHENGHEAIIRLLEGKLRKRSHLVNVLKGENPRKNNELFGENVKYIEALETTESATYAHPIALYARGRHKAMIGSGSVVIILATLMGPVLTKGSTTTCTGGLLAP